MIRIEVNRIFPVSVRETFAYITDMKNWPEYWPDFVRIANPADANWRQPGDSASLVIRLLNRERVMHMEMTEFQKDTRVTYVSHQPGLPDARHERHFKAVPAGCEYRLVVEFEPRPGLLGLFDRLLVKRSVERALRKTVHNLERVFRHRIARA